MTPQSPSPPSVQPPEGYEWHAEAVREWRVPPWAATRCWHGICNLMPVAELEWTITSPSRGEIAVWRGSCTGHLAPLWVDGDVVYRWVLRSLSSEIRTGQEAGVASPLPSIDDDPGFNGGRPYLLRER